MSSEIERLAKEAQRGDRAVPASVVRAVLSALLPPSEGAVEAAAREIEPHLWASIDANPETWAWRKGQEMKHARRIITAFVTHILEESGE